MFHVEWLPSALHDMAAICVEHPDRWSDLDAAENDIDYKLRKNPIHFSQPISEGLRRILSAPLAAYFSIDDDTIKIDGVGWLN
jgi:hypothetical protein